MEVVVSLFGLKMAARSWPQAKGQNLLFPASIGHSVGYGLASDSGLEMLLHSEPLTFGWLRIGAGSVERRASRTLSRRASENRATNGPLWRPARLSRWSVLALSRLGA